MSLFITGTDTHVGKTYVAAQLVRAARAAGFDCVPFKPICCGERDDAETLHTASGGALELNEVNPVWLRPPAAPYTAAMIENRPIDLVLTREVAARLSARHAAVVAEGAGGWAVPITADFRFSHLAVELGWPVLVVAANRLGALNHTLLTVEAVRASGLVVRGILLNHPAPPAQDPATVTNRGILESLVSEPVWELPYGAALETEVSWRVLLVS